MMSVSVFASAEASATKWAESLTITGLRELASVILTSAWSPATFLPSAEGRHRLNANVEAISLLVLDIDEGLSLAGAKARLDKLGYGYILATSRSHQQPKGSKPACDRFRIVMPLSEALTTDSDFKATWWTAAALFPEADPACKDAARFYYPCTELVAVEEGGADFPVRLAEAATPLPKTAPAASQGTKKGMLSRATLSFVAAGPTDGGWHSAFFKAATDLKEQLYSLEEAEALLTKASTYEPPHLDTTDLMQLRDIYSRPAKYPPREALVGGLPQPNALGASSAARNTPAEEPAIVIRAASLYDEMASYLSDKDQVKGLPTLVDGLDKLLGGGKRLGEITVTHAHAKTGKNTLWHALMYRWLEAGVPVAYASRELSPASEVLPNLLTLKHKENAWLAEADPVRYAAYKESLASWPLYFSQGYGCFPLDELSAWIMRCQDTHGVGHFWIDHLHYLLEDPEDHKYASKFIKELKALAKRLNVHIDLVVQPNKLLEGQRLDLNSIKGGAAIGQALDNLITLERVKEDGAPPNLTKLTLEVARSKLARPGSIYLSYDPATTDFTETERTRLPSPEQGEGASSDALAAKQSCAVAPRVFPVRPQFPPPLF